MRLSTRTRRAAIAMGLASAATFAAALHVRAQDEAPPPNDRAGAFWPMQRPTFLAEESGVPPRGLRLRAIVARAWEDSIATWKRVLGGRSGEVGAVSLRFVSRLAPNNCYGLYAGEGPAYCSGNRTVFVGTDAAKRLMARFGPQGEAGIAFLIGHEIGHHIQNIHGRFLLLGQVLSRAPASRADLIRRFELEADCYAGVWINASESWARSSRFRAQMLAVVRDIGDDVLLGETSGDGAIPVAGMHGTSEQRTRWFLRGADSGSLRACNTFRAAQP